MTSPQDGTPNPAIVSETPTVTTDASLGEDIEDVWSVAAKRHFGLGFGLLTLKDGSRVIYHGGMIYGFSTMFFFIPSMKFGLVVTCCKGNFLLC